VEGRDAHHARSLADRQIVRRGRFAAHLLRGYVSRSLHADDARRVSGFRFRLYSDNWNELGEFDHRSELVAGDEFLMADGRRFRIIGIVVCPTTWALQRLVEGRVRLRQTPAAPNRA
jgi:hypothetical protein